MGDTNVMKRSCLFLGAIAIAGLLAGPANAAGKFRHNKMWQALDADGKVIAQAMIDSGQKLCGISASARSGIIHSVIPDLKRRGDITSASSSTAVAKYIAASCKAGKK